MAGTSKPRVLMDSSALIALIRGEPGSDRLDGLMAMVSSGEVQLVASVLILGEVYKRSEAQHEVERHRQDARMDNVLSLLDSREAMLLDVTTPIVRMAAQYRRNNKPRHLPDAIHLATAVLNRCDWMVTLDDDFPNVDGLRTVRMEHLKDVHTSLPWEVAIQETLFADSSNFSAITTADASTREGERVIDGG